MVTTTWFAGVADEHPHQLPSIAQRRARTAIMVHRGSSDLAVENTLAAIQSSFLTGADGVEIDIAQTSDGVLVLMHDPWVDRVLEGFGKVAELAYDNLRALRFRDPYGFTRADEHVPTLREALGLIAHYNGLIHLDIKVPGIDRQVHELLVEMDLLQNVVTVNDYNADAVRADHRIKVLPSQGSLIHGNNDYDGQAVRNLLARRPKGTLLVDDARCAAALLGRERPENLAEILPAELPTNASAALEADEKNSDAVKLLGRLSQFPPVEQFDTDSHRSSQLAETIQRRARIAEALASAADADAAVFAALETMIKQRSLHIDGAWQGLDGSKAVMTLAAIRPDARTVTLLDQVVRQVDPQLKAVEQREELPWWLRQSGAWWDFRIKTASLDSLGRIGIPEARDALWEMLELSLAEAEPRWRELHWDAARALTGGKWQLRADELRRLLVHESAGVRRAGCVYLFRRPDEEKYQVLVREYLSWMSEAR